MQITAPRMTNGQYAWWLVGEDRARTLPAHADCIHRKYRLTCAQYEALIERCRNCCEVCGVPAETVNTNNPRHLRGRLHVDHDHALGLWAVRGPLCRYCNNTIDRQFMGPRFRDYEARAFHRTLTNFATPPPEPPRGATVRDFAFREWRREPDGWVALHSQAWQFDPVLTWQELILMSGPHNLTVATAA